MDILKLKKGDERRNQGLRFDLPSLSLIWEPRDVLLEVRSLLVVGIPSEKVILIVA